MQVLLLPILKYKTIPLLESQVDEIAILDQNGESPSFFHLKRRIYTNQENQRN